MTVIGYIHIPIIMILGSMTHGTTIHGIMIHGIMIHITIMVRVIIHIQLRYIMIAVL